MSQVSTKEPLFHIVKREGVTFVRASLIRLVAILLALVVCAFVIMGMTGMNPLSVYAGIWSGAVGTARRTWVTLRDSAILLCIGFAVLPAFRMRFWNIGAEGQVLVGAMATAAVMIYGADLPSWALYALCPIAGVAAGSLWGMIPAFFKARWNTNETLFTLMLNYIAMQAGVLRHRLLGDPQGFQPRGPNQQPDQGRLAALHRRQRLPAAHHHRDGADGADVPVHELLQAGL